MVAFNPEVLDCDQGHASEDCLPGGDGEWDLFNALCRKVFTSHILPVILVIIVWLGPDIYFR